MTEYQFDEKIDLLKASLNRNGIHFRVRLTRLTKAKVTLCSSEPVGNSKHWSRNNIPLFVITVFNRNIPAIHRNEGNSTRLVSLIGAAVDDGGPRSRRESLFTCSFFNASKREMVHSQCEPLTRSVRYFRIAANVLSYRFSTRCVLRMGNSFAGSSIHVSTSTLSIFSNQVSLLSVSMMSCEVKLKWYSEFKWKDSAWSPEHGKNCFSNKTNF